MSRPAVSIDDEATWPRFVLAGLLSVAILAAAMLAALVSCTPAARRDAGTAISTVAPALCALTALLAPDGSPAGLVCADLSRALGAALTLARVDTGGSVAVRATVGGCTPVLLVTCDPKRDPREYVCAEAYGGAEGVCRALSAAKGMGHAR